MFKLADLNERSYADGHLVARDASEAVAWSRFMSDVACTRQLFRDDDKTAWALFDTDSYRFAVGLFALLSEGKRVYLPGENHAAMVASLRAEGAGFVGQFPGDEALIAMTGQTVEALSPMRMSGSIVVFTSGSTGQAKPITKSLAQVDAELAALEQTWGGALGDSLIVGTVSHQHFYGLLFSVLWPVCAGRCFWRKPFVDPVIMAATAARFGASAWVMSPAHLHRLGTKMPWDTVRDSTTAVFSSGGPLEQRAAQSVFDGLGQYPWEVLGSSETGGIAWRQQAELGTSWTPIRGVEVALDGDALAVRSDWLADDKWYVTADQATLDPDGGFSLGLRLDRIVKVEGKRVSLPQTEAALATHPWIEQCVVAVLQRRRQYIGAVVVLTAEGAREYAASGHHRFARAMRAYLGDHLAAAAIPRVWRVSTALPRNAQSKIQHKTVQGLFDSGTLPPVLNRQDTADGCRLILQVRGDSPYFEGHFPDTPVLPGVVQLAWAQQFAIDLLGLQGEFQGMRAVKFKELIFPQQELTLSLNYSRDSGRLDFQFDSRRGRHSQGTLLYDATP